MKKKEKDFVSSLSRSELRSLGKFKFSKKNVLLSPKELEKLFSKVDLIGIVTWSVQEQKEVRDMITEFVFLFALDDLDLGKTSVVKHTMKLTNPTPFNERYRQFLPDQFEEMKKHLQEILEIGAIRKSCSPLAVQWS